MGFASEDEKAVKTFEKAQKAFHSGKYHETVNAIAECLAVPKSLEYMYIEADAYNLLGMLFSFVGYEDMALDNYLFALKSSQDNDLDEEQIMVLLNIGLLYEGLGDLKKALQYYKQAFEVVGENKNYSDADLIKLTLIQQAEIYQKLGKREDVRYCLREVAFYNQLTDSDGMDLPKTLLEMKLETEDGAVERADELTDKIYHYLELDRDYLEQIDLYVDFCQFLLENNRKAGSRKFIDILTRRLEETEFYYLKLRLGSMDVEYKRKYESVENFQEACLKYLQTEKEYDKLFLEFKKKNLGHIENLLEVENQKQEFEKRSRFDLATGLLNKECFRQDVERCLGERKKDSINAFVIIDIDDFKLVNDTYGHLLGDEVIKKLAENIKERFENDICGRFGGDEFVIFLSGISETKEMEKKIEELRATFENHRFGKNNLAQCTISVGVSYDNGFNASYSTMFSCADEALRKVKEYGKNRVTFYEIKKGLVKYV